MLHGQPRPPTNLSDMPTVLICSDAPWVHDEIRAAVPGGDTVVRSLTAGRSVRDVVATELPDLVILDMQISDMGAVAVTYDLRLEASGDRSPDVPILLLLDRNADVYMAKQCDADGWLIKPLDPIRLRKAMRAVLAGERYEDKQRVGDATTNFRATADSTAR
jgi:DNA-binding response OmpR family regulator